MHRLIASRRALSRKEKARTRFVRTETLRCTCCSQVYASVPFIRARSRCISFLLVLLCMNTLYVPRARHLYHRFSSSSFSSNLVWARVAFSVNLSNFSSSKAYCIILSECQEYRYNYWTVVVFIYLSQNISWIIHSFDFTWRNDCIFLL